MTCPTSVRARRLPVPPRLRPLPGRTRKLSSLIAGPLTRPIPPSKSAATARSTLKTWQKIRRAPARALARRRRKASNSNNLHPHRRRRFYLALPHIRLLSLPPKPSNLRQTPPANATMLCARSLRPTPRNGHEEPAHRTVRLGKSGSRRRSLHFGARWSGIAGTRCEQPALCPGDARGLHRHCTRY